MSPNRPEGARSQPLQTGLRQLCKIIFSEIAALTASEVAGELTTAKMAVNTKPKSLE